ncbi:MAG: CDP-glucose 4,6-dehydratase [Desulfobacteria bacterium]
MTTAGLDRGFWRGKRVFLTGHTGFKGSWLSLWLTALGAEVSGYALDPPTDPSLYELARVDTLVKSAIADVRDAVTLARSLAEARPDVVFHLAAQPLVRESYRDPVNTYSTNVMGTVNLLEAVRVCDSVRAVVNVTTDKCYENREWPWGYRENEALGGHDPYSSSKACSELVTSAYRRSFFTAQAGSTRGACIASARAGNVIGGGDFAKDRLLPDCVRAVLAHEKILLRNPGAVRPWQHVLDPLAGYLLLAQRLVEDGPRFAEAWNFGPEDSDARTVEWVVRRFCEEWGEGASCVVDQGEHPHEAGQLRLDCSKARQRLGWTPLWSVSEAIQMVVEWTRSWNGNGNVRETCIRQIRKFDDGTRRDRESR